MLRTLAPLKGWVFSKHWMSPGLCNTLSASRNMLPLMKCSYVRLSKLSERSGFSVACRFITLGRRISRLLSGESASLAPETRAKTGAAQWEVVDWVLVTKLREVERVLAVEVCRSN